MSLPSTDVDSAWYGPEAETFVTIRAEMVPYLILDYSTDSLDRLEAFIAAQFDPPGTRDPGQSLPVGIGCYLGEVIRRNLGGYWNRSGRPEISGLGQIKAIYPIQKAGKRFANGPTDSLTTYFQVVAGYMGRQE
jgi:hypothetical protein